MFDADIQQNKQKYTLRSHIDQIDKVTVFICWHHQLTGTFIQSLYLRNEEKENKFIRRKKYVLIKLIHISYWKNFKALTQPNNAK